MFITVSVGSLLGLTVTAGIIGAVSGYVALSVAKKVGSAIKDRTTALFAKK